MSTRKGTTVLLLRHGETAFNVHDQFRGRADPELTPVGVEQAKALARAVARWSPSAMFSSPRIRAVHTARAISSAIAMPASVDARVDDIDYGGWTGLSKAEVAARWPSDYRLWLTAPEEMSPAGRECVVQVAERVSMFLREVTARWVGGTVAVVTHDVIIRLALCQVLKAPFAAMHQIRAGVASLSEASWGEGPVIERLNDCQHLAS